jgi:hypothetical protein
MAKTAVYDYSTTASSNSDFDGTDSSGATGKVKDGDNYARSIASHVKGFALDLGAVNTVGGTADAITVTLSSAPSALVDGMRITINASAANTGATTLNVTPAGGSAFGAKKVMKWSAGSEAELSANDIPAANALIELVYDSARNAAAGAWMLLGTSVAAATTTAVLTGTSTTDFTTPDSIAALWEKGSDEASSGTVAFGEGGFFHITGTTTITDIDFDTAKDGRAVDVVFDGALTLTHNGTTLQLPGGANITTAAGDRARFVQDSSDNIICLWYVRAGAPPSLGPHVILEDQKAQNTAGGTFTSGADQTRVLNTEVYDPYGLCALSSNQFTLGAGTWYARWSAPAFNVGRHQSWLYNVTDTSVVGRATSDNVGSSSASLSSGGYVFTITASKAFEIRHRCQVTAATNGFGVEGNFGTEIYTRVEITKVA